MLSPEAEWMIGNLVKFQLILCSFLLVSIVPINFFFLPFGRDFTFEGSATRNNSQSLHMNRCLYGVVSFCVNWSTFYTTGIKVSEIKVGPQPLELISTHNGRQCVLVYTSATTVRRSNLVLLLEKNERGSREVVLRALLWF